MLYMQETDAPSVVIESGGAKQPTSGGALHPQAQSTVNDNSALPDVIMMNGLVVDQGAVSGITFMQPVEPNGINNSPFFSTFSFSMYT